MEILPLGDSALLINFQQEINEEVNGQVMQWANLISRELADHTTFVSPAYCSLTVGYKSMHIHFEAIRSLLFSLKVNEFTVAKQDRILRVPVCYQGAYAPDLGSVAKMKDRSPEEIVELHTSKPYRVYMLGFLPGFVYLGKVGEELYTERKDLPLTAVPAGSVGIAGWQTGIYPSVTPGGWHLIGRTPVPLLLRDSHPSPFRAGDTVYFYPIDSSQFSESSIQYDV